MKKNKMMRLASVLLILVLLTTSVISGTFAKYASELEVKDQARVAYWGFGRATATTFDLFDGSYTDDTNGITVRSDENVVAPGTSKETEFGFAYIDNGNNEAKAPEVAYTFVVDADITGNYAALDANPSFKWKLGENKYDTVSQLLKAIEDLDGNKNQNRYEAGVLPNGFGVADKHTIGWEWAFEDAGKTKTQDKTDTAMGNADELANVAITITIRAEQID